MHDHRVCALVHLGAAHVGQVALGDANHVRAVPNSQGLIANVEGRCNVREADECPVLQCHRHGLGDDFGCVGGGGEGELAHVDS